MKTRVCLAGATGWVGKALSKAIYESQDFELVAAVARTSAGRRLGDTLGIANLDLEISSNVQQALATTCDVLIDYTHPTVVKTHVMEALSRNIPVVIGTSGLTEDDFTQIDELARKKQVGVLAAGNFAITAVLLQRFAMLAAKYISHWEIIDYATAEKPDAPSGTARELATKLSQIKPPVIHIPIENTHGQKEARGATVGGTQIHSIRLPSYTFAFQIIFGLQHEKLTLHHEADSSPDPYVLGTLLAARHVRSFVGLKRGLDSVLEA